MKCLFSAIRRYHFLDALLLLSIFQIGLNLLADLESSLDLALSDESTYLIRGLKIGTISIKPEDSPVYSVWYYFLHYFQSNNILLYYLNWRITTVLPALLFYLALRVYKTSFYISLLFSLFLLFTHVNVTVWPRVSNFCVCFILISVILFGVLKERFNKLFFVSVSTFFVSYIRPEFFISFIIFLFLLVYCFFKDYYVGKEKRSLKIVGIIVAVFLVKYFYGFPMFEKNSERSVVAFGQHFVVNKFLREGIWGVDPWVEWEKYFYPVFGNVSSFSEIILSNPKVLLAHIKFNLYWFTVINFAVVKDFLAPFWFFNTDLGFFVPIFFLVVVPTIYNILYYGKVEREYTSTLVFKFLPFVVFILPCIISSIVIFPRQHYDYMIFVIMVAFMLVWMQPFLRFLTFKIRYKRFVIILVMFLIIFYVVSLDVRSGNYFRSCSLPVKDAVDYMNTYCSAKKLLVSDAGVSGFLSNNFTCIPAVGKDCGFRIFMIQKSIDMVWVTEDLLSHNAFINDVDWLDFLEHFENYGFRRNEKSGMHGYLLVKEK